MRKSSIFALILLHWGYLAYSQTIPVDSMYLGHKPPGATPEKFNLPVTKGSFAAERIAISKDRKSVV